MYRCIGAALWLVCGWFEKLRVRFLDLELFSFQYRVFPVQVRLRA